MKTLYLSEETKIIFEEMFEKGKKLGVWKKKIDAVDTVFKYFSILLEDERNVKDIFIKVTEYNVKNI